MVYIHFPSNLTEEEQMLQNKYQKLKKKKKALQQLRAPKPEPEKIQPVKRPIEAKDAKEVAKKLLKSGAISAIKVDTKEKQGFKRSKTQERKSSVSDKSQVSGYHPFQSAHAEEGKDSASGSKSFYESDRESRDSRPERPKQGNTIYVQGCGVTEEIFRKAFTQFGNILNISMESGKNCGFVTFEKVESADKAINEMRNAKVSDVPLKVSLARRQPTIDTSTTETQSSNWTSIASNKSQKGCHKDKRELVTYEEDIFS